MSYRKGLVSVACLTAGLVAVQAHAAEEWHFSARINAWLPDVSGETAFFDRVEEQDFHVEIDDILDDVEFGFMGSFEARKGQWGVFTDLIYASVGDDSDRLREGSIGIRRDVDTQSKISAGLDVDSWVWNTAGFYRVLQSDSLTLDLLAGVRYIDVEQELDWTINTSIAGQPLPEVEGSAEIGEDSWDVFLGVRGRIPLTQNGLLFIPFYLDGGTGDADFTWQAATGLGYAMGRWNMGLVWRHLEYDLDSGAAIGELELSGPAGVFEYNW